MASHGVRKLGLITGIFMLLFLFIDTLLPASAYSYIAIIPLSGTVPRVFYVWGYVDGTVATNMLSLAWPDCIIAWLTTIFFFFATVMTISACTPGSLSANSKRLFGIASIFCFVHATFYIILIGFSSIASLFFLLIGPGFYLLVIFGVLNIISWVKVQ
ncbi:MAG TPA: hypothetical protein VKM55_21830 [Candidatus Lokiarchaeia archaeon]|nr:hypothetical protein [Candidatus Lokiarchaeia archaeon]